MWKIINLKTLLKSKEELKGIKVTFINEPAGKTCGERRDFCPEKLLPNQANELTVGNGRALLASQWGPGGGVPGKPGN